MDLTEAEDIKKNIQKNYKKKLHDPDNHDGMITYLEADILECEVKWTLGSITMVMEFLLSYFKSLKKKNDAVKVLPSVCQQIW